MKYTRNTLCLIFGFVLGYLTTNLNKKYNKPPNYQYNCKNYYIKNFTITPFVIKKTNNRDSLKKNYIISHANLTCYQPVTNQCDKNPLTTADGSKIDLKHLKRGTIKWCAISRDFIYLFPKNKIKKVYIEGYGIYEVRDLMNKRYKHSIDLLQHPANSKLVKKEDVKIRILL